MPQLSLLTESAFSVPHGLRLELRSNPLLPEEPLVATVSTMWKNGWTQPVERPYEGLEVDYLPTLAQAVVEAYLWGESALAVESAAVGIAAEARRARTRHLRRGGV